MKMNQVVDIGGNITVLSIHTAVDNSNSRAVSVNKISAKSRKPTKSRKTSPSLVNGHEYSMMPEMHH